MGERAAGAGSGKVEVVGACLLLHRARPDWRAHEGGDATVGARGAGAGGRWRAG